MLLVTEYEQVAETQPLRTFAEERDIPPQSLRNWVKKRRLERDQRLVPLVLRPAANDGVAVIVRLGSEPTVEIFDPARAPAEWITELLRELTKESA